MLNKQLNCLCTANRSFQLLLIILYLQWVVRIACEIGSCVMCVCFAFCATPTIVSFIHPGLSHPE